MKTITREGIKRIIGPVSGSGGSRGAGGGDISLAGLASEAWVEENYISKAFFNRLFTIHSASGVIDPNDPDEEQTIDSIEALVGFWTEEYVSALGQNSGGGGGGGGGGVTLNQPLEAINNAGLSAPTTAGTALVWYNGSWTYSPGARLQIGGITATGTVLVNSSVTANSFIKTGGTSSMFLKADGSVDTNTYASETWVSQNYVSIQFFETLFNAINAQGVKVNANSITGIDSIKAMFGLWTERYMSALGQNSGGGGGGGVTLNQPLSGINNAGMNAPGTAGSLLVWNGTTWTYSAAASIVATTATFYGNSYAAGFAVTNKDNTYVLLAGGGTKLLSELGGHTSVSYNGNVYSPSSGVVALGYLTTSVKVNSSTYSVNSSGLVDIGSVVTAVKIAGTLTPYSPTAGVVEIPAYPTIPTNVSAFTNDAGYVSTSVSLSDPHLVLASPSGSGGPASFRALVASDIPDLSSIYATSDTWRTVQCNGVSIGNNALNLVAGTNVAISASNGTLTFSSTDTNTLNTAGAVQLGSVKLYLVGASSQTDGVKTYSNSGCYIGTDGCLYSNGSKVMTAASGYLPLTGGTLTGGLEINESGGNNISLKSHTPSGSYSFTSIIFTKNIAWSIGANSNNNFFVWNDYISSGFPFLLSRTGVITCNGIAINGGTSSQFLKADGSLDSTSYLPKTGGTLTGSDNPFNLQSTTSNSYVFYKILVNGSPANAASTGYYAGLAFIANEHGTYARIGVADDGTPQYWPNPSGNTKYTLYHSGNVNTIGVVTGIILPGESTPHFPSTGIVSLPALPTAGGTISGLIGTSRTNMLEITTNTNTDWVTLTSFHIPSLSTGYHCQFNLGVSKTANNETAYSFYYAGSGSTANRMAFGFYGNGEILNITAGGQVAIGTTDSSKMLDYTLYCWGKAGGASAWINASDIRMKEFVSNTEITLSNIASAPIFYFYWKDPEIDTLRHVGTSAQYWQKVLPEVVSGGGTGMLGLDYGATALAAAVITARKVSEHERRIAELERENKVLWNMIASLKAS